MRNCNVVKPGTPGFLKSLSFLVCVCVFVCVCVSIPEAINK